MTETQTSPQEHSATHSTSQNMLALIRLLEEETRQYEHLRHKLYEKQNILIAGKPGKLTAIDRELTSVGQKAKTLEKQRLELMNKLGQPENTLSQFIHKLESHQPKAAADLRRCRERLLSTVHDTQRANRDTQDLLNLSLQWIHDTVELIASVLTPEAASYTAKGQKLAQSKSPGTSIPAQSTVNHSA